MTTDVVRVRETAIAALIVSKEKCLGREFANTAPHIGGDVATLRRGRDSRHRLLPRGPNAVTQSGPNSRTGRQGPSLGRSVSIQSATTMSLKWRTEELRAACLRNMCPARRYALSMSRMLIRDCGLNLSPVTPANRERASVEEQRLVLAAAVQLEAAYPRQIHNR